MKNPPEELYNFRNEIQDKFNVYPETKQDYITLTKRINEKLKTLGPRGENNKPESISEETIYKVWEYRKNNEAVVSSKTLGILARSLSYPSWNKYKENYEKNKVPGSLTSKVIDMDPDAIEKAFNSMDYFNFSSLRIGEVIFIGWYQKKYCRLKKIQEEDFEEDSFEVIESYGMKSEVGRKFSTSGFELAPAPNKTIFPEVIVIPRYEYQTELWEYYDSIDKSGKFDIQTCPPELLL